MASDYVSIELPEIFFELKKIPMMRHAVVAGGYIRNKVLGVKPSDLDIFIPITSENKFLDDFSREWKEFEKLGVSFDNAEAFRRTIVTDSGYSKKLDLKVQYNLKDKTGLDIDLMAMRLNVDGFMTNLLEGFPFCNQQVVSDGKKVVDTEQFERDISMHTMTLRLLDNVSDLPKVISKFNKLKEIYPDLKFRTDYVLQKRTGDDWL